MTFWVCRRDGSVMAPDTMGVSQWFALSEHAEKSLTAEFLMDLSGINYQAHTATLRAG
jgi:hypothetical protein